MEKYYFVDESGDPTFFNKYGECLLGRNGCSPLLILGFVRTDNPREIREAITALHKNIASNEYLKDIPSINKTNLTFHAKDDVPEVREKVFTVIKALDFKAEFIVARKRMDIFNKRHKRNENVFYNEIVSRLFENKLHTQDNIICFSKRGNKLKQEHMQGAIQSAILNFENKTSRKIETSTKIIIQTPTKEPCLQVIDYINWAVQRMFIKREMRYFNFMKDKISFICDIYDFEKYPNNFYNKKNEFSLEKISPL
ncbi:MAG: DUF3800 domain-containing protein [Candidatus Margulisbacteria bacterium]|jgi:hypothetical protein|nr:DUF3800 domain-containing protein [Candidatus Margulisiibacteriota bacterium]